MSKDKFSLRKRIKSFTYAFEGLRLVFAHEHNAWIHVVATICVVVAGFLFRISSLEWTVVLICIAMVISSEIINSSLERMADFVQPEMDNRIKEIKDLGAAAVLVCAIASVIVGIIIFLPKIIAFVS
ncbi:MAG: diacylglycerol kinase family protein [Bacteroidales bacterium]|nr:diacylglycerol kinase family protein [Bacteroidales bacterium]